MKESVTYQAIVEEGLQKGLQKGLQEGLQKGRQKGKVEEAQQMLLRVGSARFKGPPNAEQMNKLDAITEVHHLEDLAVRVLDVQDWSELLATALPSRRRKKS